MRFDATKKLYQKIVEKGKTFSAVALLLKERGIEVRSTTVFHWADGRKVPNKREKKALAKVLECKVEEIF